MFYLDRATAITTYFLERSGGELNDIKLAKLQYIAERRAIVNHLSPITHDEGVSLHHGPCLSETLYLVNDSHADSFWDEHVSFERFEGGDPKSRETFLKNKVHLESSLNASDYLSDIELEVIRHVWDGYGHVDTWALRRWCHDCYAEYKEVGIGGSARITLEAIFMAEGDTSEVATHKANEIRYIERFRETFAAKESAVG